MEQKVDMKLAQLGNEAQAITDRMKKVEKNIDRIENHPTFADKMKKFATGKGEHPLDKYKAELATLQQDAVKIQQESAALINKKGFNAELRNQTDHPHTQQTQQQNTGHKVRQDVGKDLPKQDVGRKVSVKDLDVPRDMPQVPDVPNTPPKLSSTRSKVQIGSTKTGGDGTPKIHHGV
jgi:hypothetical protein